MKKQNDFVFSERKASTDEVSCDDKNTSESKNLTFDKLAFSFAVIVLLYYTVCINIYVDELRSETKGLHEETRNGRAPPPSPSPAVL